VKPSRPEPPAVARADWARTAIDRFVLARLEREKLTPSPEAARPTLLRRVTFDLTGLPPTPEQLAAWNDQREPLAVAVDELLASPQFGERMAADWMDVARYADTHGFNNDSMRSMWRWRDWVIGAFNRNLPYDQFITEQLAGDLLKEPTLDQFIATGFNRNHVINSEGGIIDEEYRVEYVADRLQTTALAWMGLTVGCARCHDHKFDPLTQRDYFRLYAFFNNIDEHGEDGRVANASPIMPAPTASQQNLMREHRAAMEHAEKSMAALVAAQNWTVIHFDSLITAANNSVVETNRIISLSLRSDDVSGGVISNLAGGRPFRALPTNGLKTTSWRDQTAIVFDGNTQLKTDALPKFDATKGWSFSAWVNREKAQDGALFSTMDFNVPESSQGYGQGVEVRVTAKGAVDVRLARRWPAYALQVITREHITAAEWHHVLVTCDGGTAAKGVRVFIDGTESFRDVLHDDLTGSAGISGNAYLGGSEEKDVTRFAGALADVRLLSQPVKPESLATTAREEVLRNAFGARDSQRLRRSWLEKNDADFARTAADWRTARSALLQLERDAPSTMIMRELSPPRPTFVLFRGQYDSPREKVEPGVPDFVMPFPESAPRNRLGLARWLVDPRHPLTARVVVNRLWQNFFSAGLVKSVEDFGFQADYPSHPELLDWLAIEFVQSGWDVKRLVRLMVSSAAYRQDSKSSDELNERDPENRLLARGPRQRLTAEMLRDQALALSGLLKNEIGGPPVYPYQPTNLYKGIVVAADYPGTTYIESKGDALYRRSLYTFWKRTVPHPTLATFDAPDREVCVGRRLKTNTPLQALALMNDTIQLEAARKLAERMIGAAKSSAAERIAFGFQFATARKPKFAEVKMLRALLEKRLTAYRSDVRSAAAFLSVGASKSNSALDVAELAAYANVASVILNLDETITRN
ncbi:MAG TPA: DUF1553 domain-containing protein, partial [Candidatus Acidoferrum sp.]|nr:DUF1553 domain-containing protein [Candidatus Acidoferrum sp.]